MRYTEEIKKQTVNRYHNGESYTTICGELGISRSTLQRWSKSYGAIAGNVSYSARELNNILRRLGRQEQMIKILKTVDCTVHAPLKDRLLALEGLYGQYEVHVLCDALDVDRGTFYNHIKRNKRDNAWYAKRREEYREIIQETFHEYHETLGAEKITAILRQQGHQVSEKYVSSIMHECGLVSIRTTAKADYMKSLESSQKKNIVQQRFQAAHPNETWVSDVTVFKINKSYIYICMIMDLYSRKIVSYRTSLKNSTQLITATFKDAYDNQHPAPGLVFHSDRGAQYTSYTFQKLLLKYQVKQSFSNPATPHDNAVAEAFFATLKRELLYRYHFRSVKEMTHQLGQYIDFYNTKRPHKALNHKTPCDVEATYYRLSK